MDAPPHVLLESIEAEAPEDIKLYFEDLKSLCERKLWHQVTLKVEELIRDPLTIPVQSNLFFQFINPLMPKLNPIKYVSIAIAISQHIPTSNETIEFLTGVADKVDTPQTRSAYVLATMEISHQVLLSSSLENVKQRVEKCQKELDLMSVKENLIHAHFYRVAAEYYKATGDFSSYYHHSLLYLSCIQVDDLSPEEKVSRAYDLSLAALLADSIYNFGELLMHPISEALIGSEHDWLHKLLLAFNRGQIGKFDTLVPFFTQQTLLEQRLSTLKQKIILMGLVEFLFNLNASSRTVGFKVVATECQIPIEEVEHLVMRALSLNLIKGSIDQVEQKITVTWVQPRYLDKHQLSTLQDKLKTWSDKVQGIASYVHQLNPELIAPQ